MSDLHLEFGTLEIPTTDDEGSTHLILAGDIFLGERHWMPVPFFEDVSSRFAQIILIAGNHEFYDGIWPDTIGTIRNIIREFPNIAFLEKESLVFNNTAFIGATLWTDMNNKDWFTIQRAKDGMSDYHQIKTSNGRILHPDDVIADHRKAVSYILNEIAGHRLEGRKTVVVTHHLPCALSIPPRFKTDPLNGAYMTELSEGIFMTQPTLWVHGHTHSSSDYFLENTRVICNPRGYTPFDVNPMFDPTLTIEIPEDGVWPT